MGLATITAAVPLVTLLYNLLKDGVAYGKQKIHRARNLLKQQEALRWNMEVLRHIKYDTQRKTDTFGDRTVKLHHHWQMRADQANARVESLLAKQPHGILKRANLDKKGSVLQKEVQQIVLDGKMFDKSQYSKPPNSHFSSIGRSSNTLRDRRSSSYKEINPNYSSLTQYNNSSYLQFKPSSTFVDSNSSYRSFTPSSASGDSSSYRSFTTYASSTRWSTLGRSNNYRPLSSTARLSTFGDSRNSNYNRSSSSTTWSYTSRDSSSSIYTRSFSSTARSSTSRASSSSSYSRSFSSTTGSSTSRASSSSSNNSRSFSSTTGSSTARASSSYTRSLSSTALSFRGRRF